MAPCSQRSISLHNGSRREILVKCLLRTKDRHQQCRAKLQSSHTHALPANPRPENLAGGAREEGKEFSIAILCTIDTKNAGMWGIRGNSVSVTREQNQQTSPRFHYS